MDDAALAELVGLGARQDHAQAVRPDGQVGHLDLDQLRPPERAGEAEQDECAVPLAPQAAAGAGQLGDSGGEQRGGLALGPGAVGAGNVLQGLAQLGGLGVEWQAEQPC